MDFGVPPAPPTAEYRELCIRHAAAYYRGSPLDVKAVMLTEGGTTGLQKRNRNGTVDLGLMQINSVHLEPGEKLYGFGYTPARIANDDCLNIHLGTYLLQYQVLSTGDRWQGIGNYHSKTPSLNLEYRQRVWKNMQTLLAPSSAAGPR